MKSPLAIAFDYLTVPEMQSSRAYVQFTLRNFLFQIYKRFPSDLADLPSDVTFGIGDVEEALSHIWTSMRPRYFSSGEDKLPAEGRSTAGGLLRQYLAAKGMLWLRFRTTSICRRFLDKQQILSESGEYEFARSEYLDRLPDLGELVNELWGIPVPIRGGDTLFRGGLKLSSRGGLVLGVHGGPGVGKTSLALALGGVLAPFGVTTLYMTAEETPKDLTSRTDALLPDDLRRRLSFFPSKTESWLRIQPFFLEGEDDVALSLSTALKELASALQQAYASNPAGDQLPKPYRAVVVLDGLHDLLVSIGKATGDSISATERIRRLREFIITCRQLRAVVILTTGEDWAGDRALDYLVDVAIHLSHNGVGEYGKKPDRRIQITKARHQLCAVGIHGFQIAGTKGVRFSPQINYQLDRRASWKTRIPNMSVVRRTFERVLTQADYQRLIRSEREGRLPDQLGFHEARDAIKLPRGANIFINGEGSGGKAALALKIALSPAFTSDGVMDSANERVLVVSFLYPYEYYDQIRRRLLRLRRLEYQLNVRDLSPDIEVVHLYPGHYQPDQLFNRIEWAIDSAELHGRPYTAIIIDGLHNVFLQFPEIEHYQLFWPQLYAALRSRPVTIISTHTTFVLQGKTLSQGYKLDDSRSEPLRHALVQKTDFQFELDPIEEDDLRSDATKPTGLSNIFALKTLSAINQPIPDQAIFWSRENLVLFDLDQGQLPFPRRRRRPVSL